MPSSPSYFQLDGNSSSLLVSNHGSVPTIAWFGEQLKGNIGDEMLANHDNAAHAFADLDARSPLNLFPQSATGYMGSPALLGHRDRTANASLFKLISALQSEQTLKIVLQDELSELELTKKLSLDENSDVATISTSLKNTGSTDYHIQWLASATLPLPEHFSHCTSMHGRWGLENQSVRRPICPGRIDFQNLHGRTGHEHTPNLIVSVAELCEDHGEALFLHLGWSGNYRVLVERLNNGDAYLQAGVLLNPGELTLAAGTEFNCPDVHFTKGEGLNQCTQRFHRFARENILPDWTRKPRPIHANSWEAMYFNLNDKDLKSLVDAATRIGAERFILDDGWFTARRDDTAGLGDWQVDKSVFAEGLAPLVAHVRSHNMQFGLWFEPEMVNPNSRLYREHPDWVLHFEQIDTPLARGQLVLNLARDDVSDYLFNCISDLVSEYQIDYIKWDMNRDLVLAGDGAKSVAVQQAPAVYALMQRLVDAHPKLEIESCASGGARCDFGVLKHTGRVWASDNIDPIARASIQQGFARFFPPEIMGAHVGHKHAHLTGRNTNLHTRAIVALQGQFGFELDARVLDDEEIRTLHHYTLLYKQHRNWLNNAIYWQLPSAHKQLIASGQVAVNQQEALFNLVLLDSLQTTRPGCQRLRGLDPLKRYSVTLSSTNVDQFIPFNRELPAWCTQAFVTTGELLMKIGLALPVMPPQSALLVYCAAEAH